jgi:hypothetical protein
MKISVFPQARKILLPALLAITLGSCSTIAPKDLRFESLAVVTLQDEPQLLNLKLKDVHRDPEKIRLLKFTLSSETDIVQFAKKNGFNVGYFTYLCDKKSNTESEIYSSAYLRVDGKSIGGAAYFEQPNLDNLRRPDGRISYYAVLPLDGKEIRSAFSEPQSQSDKTKIELYDFQRHTSDVCIQLRGGAMWLGGSFTSNVVVIPRDAMSKVLR